MTHMHGSYTIGVYAGVSVDRLTIPGGPWHGLSLDELLPGAQEMAVTVALARHQMDQRVRHSAGNTSVNVV
jgi:hypothetical protein